MTQNDVRNDFKNEKNCTEILLNKICFDALPKDIIKNLSLPFAGGMHCGKTCGAVTGAYIALGLKTKSELKEEFDSEFLKEFKSLECREILGFDLSKADELNEINKQGLFLKICPKVVKFAVDFIETKLNLAKNL